MASVELGGGHLAVLKRVVDFLSTTFTCEVQSDFRCSAFFVRLSRCLRASVSSVLIFPLEPGADPCAPSTGESMGSTSSSESSLFHLCIFTSMRFSNLSRHLREDFNSAFSLSGVDFGTSSS